MRLLLQLDGDLPDRFPGHRRRLYIFVCMRRTCNRKAGSVRALRGVRTDWDGARAVAGAESMTVEPAVTPTSEALPKRDIGRELFGGESSTAPTLSSSPSSRSYDKNANPFTSPSSDIPQALAKNPFSALDAKSSLGAKAPQKPACKEGLASTFAAKIGINDASQAGSPGPAPIESHARLQFEAWPAADNKRTPVPYTTCFLDAEYETLDTLPQDIPISSEYTIDERADDDSALGGKGSSTTHKVASKEREVFESSLDKTFQRFADRVAQNPLQVLRYEFGGMPLLYSSIDQVGKLFPSSSHNEPFSGKVTTTRTTAGSIPSGSMNGISTAHRIPPCNNCSKPRTYELQLMPHAIDELEPDQDLSEEKGGVLEWGTLLLGTCSQDCVPSWSISTPTTDTRPMEDNRKGDGKEDGSNSSVAAADDVVDTKKIDQGSMGGYLEEWVGVQWE